MLTSSLTPCHGGMATKSTPAEDSHQGKGGLGWAQDSDPHAVGGEVGSPASSTLSFRVGGRAEEAGQHLGCGNQTQGPVVSWRSRGTEQLPQIWSSKGGGKQFGLNKLEGAELSSLPLTIALCCPQPVVGGQSRLLYLPVQRWLSTTAQLSQHTPAAPHLC